MIARLKFWFVAATLGTLPLLALGFLTSRPAAAAGLWYVAPVGNDTNDCQTTVTACATINAAIGKSGVGDTIDVAVGTYTANSGDQVVLITRSVTLLGGWNSGFTIQSGLSTIDGQDARRGMTINGLGEASVTVEQFVLQNGSAVGGGGIQNEGDLTLVGSQVIHNSSTWEGGGIRSNGWLTVTRTVVGYNSAAGGGGGGILNHSALLLNDSTITGNILQGGFSGAGILGDGPVTVINSTVSDNQGGNGEGIKAISGAAIFNTTISGNSGIGLYLQYSSATVENSILAGNGSTDCSGNVNSQGYNIIQTSNGCSLVGTDINGVDARLDTLQDNGGPAPTQALLPGSPAINGGSPGGCFGPDGLLATDERGYPRLGRCDIGAFELQPLDFTTKTVNHTSSLPGQPLLYTISLSNTGLSALTSVAVTDTLPAALNYTNGSLTATGGSYIYSAGVITWTGPVNAGAPVTIQFDASTLPNASLGTVIINTAIISGEGQVVSRRAVTTLALAKLYLPLMSKPRPGIQGYVTFNGAPAADVFLELRHFDGQSFSTQASGNTDANGFYDFQAPSLPAGQYYYVRYLNHQIDPSRLSFWATANINSYTAGNAAAGGSFDLGDVVLTSPASGATVALPAPFQWVRRPATPTDSYQFSLFDPNGNAFGQTGLLGYVNGLTLTGVPSNFHSGIPYGWYVAINSPDGGYGESYYYRPVTFSNVLADSQPSVAGGVQVSPARPPVDRPRP